MEAKRQQGQVGPWLFESMKKPTQEWKPDWHRSAHWGVRLASVGFESLTLPYLLFRMKEVPGG